MTGKSKDYFSGRADAVDDAVRLLNNHAAMFTSQTSCVIAALAKQVETLKEGDDMALYRWLEQAAKSDYKEVSEAARTMMAYYQGAEFQTKEQESLAAQPDADGLPSVPSEIINAISHYGDERDGGTNSAQAFGDVVRLIRVELSRAQTAPAVDLASVSGEEARCIQAAAEFIQDISDAQPEIGHPELAERLRALLSQPAAPVSEQPAAQTEEVPEVWLRSIAKNTSLSVSARDAALHLLSVLPAQQVAEQVGEQQEFNIEAAAKKLSECMDYPWDHMPEQGRQSMRAITQRVLAAANSQAAQAKESGNGK